MKPEVLNHFSDAPQVYLNNALSVPFLVLLTALNGEAQAVWLEPAPRLPTFQVSSVVHSRCYDSVNKLCTRFTLPRQCSEAMTHCQQQLSTLPFNVCAPFNRRSHC